MNFLAKKFLEKAAQSLPFSPFVAWREMEPSTRAGVRIALELFGAAAEIGAADPPAEVWEHCLEAGAATGLPAELLAAVADTLQGVPGRSGVIGLPDRLAQGTDRDQVMLAASAIARVQLVDGTAAAIVRYAGTKELAGRIAGTMMLYMARKVDVGGFDGLREALELLDEGGK